MKCCDRNNCNQGRDCPNRESMSFDSSIGMIIDFLACVGLFATVAILGVAVGYSV